MSLHPRAGRGLLLVAGFTLLTALLTHPLLARAGTAGPINTGDGQLSIWNVAWVARVLVIDPLHLYDANIFAPHPRTLAYSEPNVVAGVLGIPGWWATRNPYFAHNTSIFLAFLLSALVTFALVRHLSGSAPAAIVSAIAFAFAPFAVVRLAHVQLLMTVGLPFSLLALHLLVERQSAGRVALLAVALVTAALGTGYYGIFAGFAVGLGFLYYGVCRGLWRSPRYLMSAVSAVLLAGLLILPFFVPYLDLERGGSAFRSLDESRRYSADWRAYLYSISHVHRWLVGWFLPFDRAAFPERVLFPGVVTCVLALVAVGGAVWAPGAAPGRVKDGALPVRETTAFYALLAFAAGWISLGPAGGLYSLLYRFVPAFTLLRAPSRFGALVALSLAVLAGLAVAMLSRRRAGWLAAPIAGALLVSELAAVPLDIRPALPLPSPYRVLATLPPGALAEFPFFFIEADFHRSALYMLYSTAHWHPIVNGYSDFIPRDYRDTVVAISTFPSREAFRLLKARGTRYVAFHPNLYDRRSKERVVERLDRYKDYVRELARDDEVWLYEIVGWP